ncbi:MAG: cyclic nucleotide-binding domain-containing protein [Candidatus Hydrogenedentes bacterium]|nr:cyclic nucleotide-binding domain-containing protein [Candidatus Hydrogenedentota bacterium]
MSENKYQRYAEKIRIFNGLQPQDVEFILHSGTVIHYHENQTIFHEGMLGSNLFIVLSGEVGIFQKNTLIGVCKVGDAFGEMAVLNHTPRSATATARIPAKCFTLDERTISGILDKRIAVRLLLNIIHVLSERLETANAQIADFRKKHELL